MRLTRINTTPRIVSYNICMDTATGFHGRGYWAVILGGSSGFGLATAKRLAKAGLNILIGHKDKEGTVETVIKPHFDEIRKSGVQLVTHNVNLFDDEGRGEVFESIAEKAGAGKVHLFMHSVAAGSCKLMSEDKTPDFRGMAFKGLAESLKAAGVPATPEQLKTAVNDAFHQRGCDALYTLADSRIPYREELLTQEDLQRTVWMMGYDYLLWGRELQKEGLLTKDARLVAMTSEGNEVAWKGYAAVSAAKCALEASCRAMAVELAPYGVRSYVVQAGITDTPAGNAIPNFDLMKAAARLRNPFHRLTTPEDVAECILSLCQAGFSWANGTIIRVDGGEAISGT
jgi:NAD(P)-dependent dehydrogenase (short-subunit alcohol dehydrogenase family)